jgi:Transposase DDE domain
LILKMDMDFASRLLSFIPDSKLEAIALNTAVDKYAKKLQGELLFKLLFYCTVTEKDNSLRGMQSALESSLFKALSIGTSPLTIAHSSISERLSSIKPEYFEKIFKLCVKKYKKSKDITENEIVRYDSTIISLSSKILDIGYNLKGGDAEKYRLLKFTVGYSDIPDCIYFYTAQTYNSENVALTETIVKNEKGGKNNITIFDRGITSRTNYDKLTDNNIMYISRLDPNAKHTIHIANTLKEPIDTDTLTILSDSWIYLYTQHKKRSKHAVRVILAIKKADGEKISFITNIKKTKTKEITEIYKSRWEIEVFFKFIKQHLNFSHLLNRSENGIKIVMYITMIVAILLEHYKTVHNIKGYKIAKKKFAQDLETDIIYNIVILCGGSPQKAKSMLYKKSP